MSAAPQGPKISLSQQIDEAQSTLDDRRVDFGLEVSRGKMRQSVADYRVTRLQAIVTTLNWLAEHETEVRAYVEFRKNAKAASEIAPVAGVANP